MRAQRKIELLLALFLLLNLAFWGMSRALYPRWAGVPPAPSRAEATAMSLGDTQLSYRTLATLLQNLGNLGNDTARLKDYDYVLLGRWFFLLSDLDPVSDHVPGLAAYYFGATRVPEDAAIVANYLAQAGSIPVGEKWRWLAQAVYLAQHRAHDLQKALDYAYGLQRMEVAGMPQWVRSMPAIVLAKRGEKNAAREDMEKTLATEPNLLPQDIETMKQFLISNLDVPEAEVDQVIRMRADKK